MGAQMCGVRRAADGWRRECVFGHGGRAGICGRTILSAQKRWLSDAVAGYRKKRDYVVKRLRAMPGVTHDYEPQGAFYAFPTVHGNFGKKTPDGTVLKDAEGVCLYLLESCLVALVPGEAFGDGNCVRLSYAASMETLKECMDRMEKGFKALKPAKKK